MARMWVVDAEMGGNVAASSSLVNVAALVEHDGCRRLIFGRIIVSVPNRYQASDQAVTITPPPPSPQSLYTMADQTKYYELYRRSRY